MSIPMRLLRWLACSSLFVSLGLTTASNLTLEDYEKLYKLPPEVWSKAFDHLTEAAPLHGNPRRWLTESPFLPNPNRRNCGEVIDVASKDEIISVVSAVAAALFPDGSPMAILQPVVFTILTRSVRYGIRAQVVCGSCDQLPFWQELPQRPSRSQHDKNTWSKYCGPGRFGANITQSGLLIIPWDTESDKPVEGGFKVSVLLCTFLNGVFAN